MTSSSRELSNVMLGIADLLAPLRGPEWPSGEFGDGSLLPSDFGFMFDLGYSLLQEPESGSNSMGKRFSNTDEQ